MSAGVTTYTDPESQHCRQLKEYLDHKGVPYRDRDVRHDPDAERDWRALGLDSLPVTVIGHEVAAGFDATRLDALLKAHDIPIGSPV